ncbi:MAG: type II toxin-antitoxin system VapC family toxin [Phycisphaerales bacterium]|nr:type II toxin-antitoxin system VapC family toxin [Phycisphaerales bacterium]
MKPIFLDTSFLLALLSRSDQYRARASAWKKRLRRGSFVTTDYVLIELADSCAATALRGSCAGAIGLLRRDPKVRVIEASASLLDRGLSLFQQRPDKRWGATDCISFCVMSDYGITRALTSDHDFEQAGFEALLRFDPPEETA